MMFSSPSQKRSKKLETEGFIPLSESFQYRNFEGGFRRLRGKMDITQSMGASMTNLFLRFMMFKTIKSLVNECLREKSSKGRSSGYLFFIWPSGILKKSVLHFQQYVYHYFQFYFLVCLWPGFLIGEVLQFHIGVRFVGLPFAIINDRELLLS